MAARTMLTVIGIIVVFGTALATAAASATHPGQIGLVKQDRSGTASAGLKPGKTKLTRARTEPKHAVSPAQIYVAPFAQHAITTKLYIYSPGPIGSGTVSAADADRCETSGSDCTEEKLCEFWGMDCPEGGIPSLSSSAEAAGAPDQETSIR